jgi:hypothetical protein
LLRSQRQILEQQDIRLSIKTRLNKAEKEKFAIKDRLKARDTMLKLLWIR